MAEPRIIEFSGIRITTRKLASGIFSATGRYTGPNGQRLKVVHHDDNELRAAEAVRFDIAATRRVLRWPLPSEQEAT